ncbi:hypothetical protein Tco_1564604, partial [Tanacetum coccineum]
MDLFAFITHADPTKFRIGEREVAEGEVPLLQLTRGSIVPLTDANNLEDVNVQGAGDDDMNEGDGDTAKENQTEQSKHVINVRGIDVVADDESLLEGSTFHVKVSVTAATTVPFVTSSVTPDYISGTGLRTRHPWERFVIYSDSSHDLNANAINDEVTFVIRSSMPPPPVLTATVATTITAGVTFSSVYGSGVGQV